MSRLLMAGAVALGVAGGSVSVPAAQAAPFYHKVCKTSYVHHKKQVTCKRVMFRKHPVRSILKEFAD